MKKGIHPEWNKDAKVIVNGKAVMTVGSTMPELNVEIWSGTHPYYTGKETVVDLDNKIDTFKKKVEIAQSKPAKSKRDKRRQKRSLSKTSSKPLTLKDMLKQSS